MLIAAAGLNIRNALAEARRTANLSLAESREVLRSGGEDGLYRVRLNGGHVVEVTLHRRAHSSATVIDYNYVE